MEPQGNSIELSTVLKYGLTEVKKAPSQMFDLVLTVFNRTYFQKVNEIF